MITRRVASAAAVTLVVVATAVPVADARLRAPALDGPGADAGVQRSPTLTWRGVKNAARYEYQASADSQFGSTVAAAKTRNTAATFKTTIPDGTYYWRVRAISAGDTAGAWSRVRSFVKRWTASPELIAPSPDVGAMWPSAPLVLRWSAVPHAASYLLVVATDPSLAQPVLGTAKKPQETHGTVFAFPGTLSTGTYYWQVTPVDSEGHRGTPSAVGRFTWDWPSALTPSVADVNLAAEVFDPLLSWTDVAGAAKYDVEVSTSEVFAPGSKVYAASVIGSAVSPPTPLPNNTYYWRARAVDPDGRAGQYAEGSFKKAFDDVVPTVRDIALRDGDAPAAAGASVSTPLLTWAPVPGAARYEVFVAPKSGSLCDWAAAVLPKPHVTTNPFLELARPSNIGPNVGYGVHETQSHLLADDTAYCVRMRAADGAGNVSEFAYLAGVDNTAAFVYKQPAAGSDGVCDALPQPTYSLPAPGSRHPRTPRFAWSAVPGARSYYVIVARDRALTNVVDRAFTDRTVYTPRDTYTDETTSYYWAVFPSPKANGGCPSDAPGTYPSFEKASEPPALAGPADGAVITAQPLFHWGAAEGAKDYRFHVARDAEFRDLVDNVVTASTAYTASVTYPVDTVLYWRVRARDDNGVELAWSQTRSVRRTLPTPVTDPANPTAGGTIPVLAWGPVQGATSYDIHVDGVDGTKFGFTVDAPRFSPVVYYGNGVWRWKVRANFPASSGTVSGPYSPAVDYVRRILAPSNARAVITRGRVVFTWDPDVAGRKYKLQVARDDTFTKVIDTVTTPNTSYAPALERGYADGGRLYWRVAILDKGNNLGAYARGDLRRPARLRLISPGVVRLRGAGGRSVTVTVRDPRGRPVRGATVSARGAGVTARRVTNRQGRVTLRLRPRRRGTIRIVATRKGYVAGESTLTVI